MGPFKVTKRLKFRYLGAVVYDCSQALAQLSDKLGELTVTKDIYRETKSYQTDAHVIFNSSKRCISYS